MAGWIRALDWRPGGPGGVPRQLRYGTLAIPFPGPLCQCLSEETLINAVVPFYVVSEEVNIPHWGGAV